MCTEARTEGTIMVEAAKDEILLSVVFRHDQSRPIGKLQDQLKEQGYFDSFPPEGTSVVSWYVMMGLGQVVTLSVPASRLRDVNRAVEGTAWGAFRSEIYATYDFRPVARDQRNGKLSLAAPNPI